jgi:hypothetical protein
MPPMNPPPLPGSVAAEPRCNLRTGDSPAALFSTCDVTSSTYSKLPAQRNARILDELLMTGVERGNGNFWHTRGGAKSPPAWSTQESDTGGGHLPASN